jgi:hypothetical protein
MSLPVIEVDAATGEVIERDFTEAELAQRALDLEAAAAAQALADEAAAKAAADKTSAVAKLAALGLTADEIAALGGK